MKISTHWLSELLPSLKKSPEEIAERLTSIGLEVEAIEKQGQGLERIVVAQVLAKEKHPQADRLSVCRVFDGSREYQVVCGAPNVEAEGKYPFALTGAVMPGGLEIKKAVLRGVESEGMLCSARELGLESETPGLLTLPAEAPIGLSFAEYYGLTDTILELNVTPNRGDCLSHLGVARELSAAFGVPFSKNKSSYKKGSYSVKSHLKVNVEDRTGCVRYCGAMIRGVKVLSSPQWLQRRLGSLGIRPINNVVDATNLVMFETGHPVHAFDYHRLSGGEIYVRRAKADLPFETLDHESRLLQSDDLVIADAKGPAALAGIMGGVSSEITEQTTEVVLEAASFDPVTVRKTAKRLALHTDSSQRFERVVPAETVSDALNRLISLVCKLAGGEAAKDIIDVKTRVSKPVTVVLRFKRLNQVLGFVVKPLTVEKALKGLGFTLRKISGGFKVGVPVFRSDVTREIDLIEEVVRLIGYDKIQPELPRLEMKLITENASSRHEEAIGQVFIEAGFLETIHYSFGEKADFEKAGFDPQDLIELANPLSSELGTLRPSLIPGLIAAVKKNQSHALETGFRFFERRSVYSKSIPEHRRLTALYTGETFDLNWKGIKKPLDFYDGKGFVSRLLQGLPVSFDYACANPLFHPRQSITLKVGEKILGWVGQLHPAVAQNFEVSQTLYILDLDYAMLADLWSRKTPQLKPISPFPAVGRDLALVCDKELSYGTLEKMILSRQVPGLTRVELFDVYEGPQLPATKKSFALTLLYENPARTLTDDEVNATHFGLVDYLKENLGVSLR